MVNREDYIMKKVLLILILLVVSSTFSYTAQAKPFNETEWALLKLQVIGMKTQIVENDMRLCIDREDFRADRKAASEDAVKKLQALEKELKKLALTPEAETLRPIYDSYIIELSNVYLNLPKKTDKEIETGMKRYWEMVEKNNKVVQDAGEKWFEKFSEAPKDFNPLNSALKLFRSEKDRDDFLKADSWINPEHSKPGDSSRRDEAFKIFDRLYKEYKGTDVEGSILARLFIVK